MTPGLVLFWIVAAVSVVTALGVVLHPNPGRSALLLVLNFVALAVTYFMLNAQVLAALQVLVYAGAIMVLFLFVIMLLNLGGELARTDPVLGNRSAGLVLAVALLGGLIWGIQSWASISRPEGALVERVRQAEAYGVSQIQIIGWDIFTRYVYPFELTSVLLLVGVVGVMLFTKRRMEARATGSTDGRRS